MFKNHIWPSYAKTSQDQSGYAAQPIPGHVTIVVAQRSSSVIATSAYEVIQACDAQRLCSALLESAHQLASVGHAQRIIEKHGAVLTNAGGRKLNVAEGVFFHGKDYVIEEYSMFGHWIESIFGELDRVCLGTMETSSLQPFVICACY
jgi:hypothetical protein